MVAKGYAAGPLKQIESMERKAKKILGEPQNSDPTAAMNPFHRNHGSFRVFCTGPQTVSRSWIWLRAAILLSGEYLPRTVTELSLFVLHAKKI